MNLRGLQADLKGVCSGNPKRGVDPKVGLGLDLGASMVRASGLTIIQSSVGHACCSSGGHSVPNFLLYLKMACSPTPPHPEKATRKHFDIQKLTTRILVVNYGAKHRIQ